MKVLGKWSLQVVCDGCEATLEVESDDVIAVGDGLWYKVDCPVCEAAVELDNRDVPPNIRKMADNK